MGRPPLALGTWGEVRVYPTRHDDKGRPDRFRAVAYYRDHDGRTRQYERTGKTQAAAKNSLRLMLKERTEITAGGDLTRMHRFSVAATLWLARVEASAKAGRRSPGTVDTYRRYLGRHVLPALGELRLGEMTTPVLDRFVGALKRDVGTATARTCRSIVSGVLGVAVRHGAISANPVREVERIEGGPAKEPRALTAEERVAWFAQLEDDEDARRFDLPELTRFLLATGARIGEALAVVWSDVDLDAGSVSITSTIIRVKGEGLIRKTTKSRAGVRVLPLPTSAVAILDRRFRRGARLDRPVFPDTEGGFRDPSNTRRALREARGSEGFAWVTSHVFRKTAATILDEAGLSSRVVADQLGHARPSMTQDVYLGRRIAGTAAAEALERALGFESGEKNDG